MKRTVIIKSGNSISVETIEKIHRIFRESSCPNESLRSVEGFTHYDGKDTVQLAAGDRHLARIDV